MIAVNFISDWGCNIICVPISHFVTPEGVNECRYLCNGKPRVDFRPDVVVSATHLACSLKDKPSLWCRDKENWVSLYPECEDDDPIVILGTSQVIAA